MRGGGGHNLSYLKATFSYALFFISLYFMLDAKTEFLYFNF